MNIYVSVPDEETEGITDAAKDELKYWVEKYATDISCRANNLAEKATLHGRKEISKGMIDRAVNEEKVLAPRKNKVLLVVLKIVSTFSLFFAGLLVDSGGYSGNLGKFIAFVICLVIAATSVVLQFTVED